MSIIFDCVNNTFKFTSKICFSLSLILFVSFLTFGCVTIIVLGCVKSARKKSMRWLYYIYQGGYILDLCIALCEYEYFGLYYKSISSAFLTCTVRFGFLMVIYAIVGVYKMALNNNFDNLSEGDSLFNCVFSEKELANSGAKNFVFNNEIETFEKLDNLNNYEQSEVVDLNVSYIDGLVKALLVKDLTDEERELCLDIVYEIKNLPTTRENTRVKKLNEKLQTLVKKAVQYNIPC